MHAWHTWHQGAKMKMTVFLSVSLIWFPSSEVSFKPESWVLFLVKLRLCHNVMAAITPNGDTGADLKNAEKTIDLNATLKIGFKKSVILTENERLKSSYLDSGSYLVIIIKMATPIHQFDLNEKTLITQLKTGKKSAKKDPKSAQKQD